MSVSVSIQSASLRRDSDSEPLLDPRHGKSFHTSILGILYKFSSCLLVHNLIDDEGRIIENG